MLNECVNLLTSITSTTSTTSTISTLKVLKVDFIMAKVDVIDFVDVKSGVDVLSLPVEHLRGWQVTKITSQPIYLGVEKCQ